MNKLVHRLKRLGTGDKLSKFVGTCVSDELVSVAVDLEAQTKMAFDMERRNSSQGDYLLAYRQHEKVVILSTVSEDLRMRAYKIRKELKISESDAVGLV